MWSTKCKATIYFLFFPQTITFITQLYNRAIELFFSKVNTSRVPVFNILQEKFLKYKYYTGLNRVV